MRPHRWRTRRLAIVLSLLVVASCGGGSHPSPPPTTPTPAPAPTPPVNTWSITGRVTALDSGAPVAGATVTPGWSLASVTTDDAGTYQLGDVANPPTTPYPVAISADGMLTHNVWFTWARGPRTGVDADLIHNVAPFSMDFYKQFVRDTYDNDTGAPFGVLRWMASPKFYVRTVDQDGRAFEPETIPTTVEAIQRSVPLFSGGRYQAAVETGTDTRPDTQGWINVVIQRSARPTAEQYCGTAYVGSNPGTITLYYDVCGACGHKIPADITVHEVGHAMGFFHVPDKNSIMYPQVHESCPRRGNVSSAEIFHAGVAYSRPRGNRDPDQDPSSFGLFGSTYEPHILVR